MSRSKQQLSKIFLTEHALSNMLEIEVYSIQHWGKRTAAKYLQDVEASLDLIRQDPKILHTFVGLPSELQFYRVNKHLLIWDVRPASIVVLTVIHSSMDVPDRLAELLPRLSAEVELLHAKLPRRRS